MFHSLGFFFALKGVALAETTVVMTAGARGGGGGAVAEMLRAAERYGATQMTAAPPVVVAMAKAGEEASRYGLPALRRVVCGGAPLHVAAARRFQSRFPRVELQQVRYTSAVLFTLYCCCYRINVLACSD